MVASDLAHPRVHRERHFDDFVEDRLVAGCTEATAIFRPCDGLEGGIGVKHAAAATAENVPVQIEQPEPRRVQQACNDALFVELCPAGEIERVDAAERGIRRVLDQPLDRVRHIRLSRLSQRRKESFGLAHTLTDRMRRGVREGRSLLWETAPGFGGHRSVRFSAVSRPTATSATSDATESKPRSRPAVELAGSGRSRWWLAGQPRPAAPLRSRDARRQFHLAPYIQHASVWSGTATKPNKMSSVSIAWLRCPLPHVSSKKSTEPDPNCLISPSDTSTATDPLSISENCLAGAGCQPRAIASGLVLISRKLVASIDAVDSISGRPGADGMIDSGSSRSANCDSPCSST